MTIRAVVGDIRRRVISSAYQRPVELASHGPIVSFTFDDFPRSALTVGGDILKSFGARGTYYAAIGLMNSITQLGEQFRQSDLDLLLSEGHELGHHTLGHISSRSVSAQSFKSEVSKGRNIIEKLTGRSTSGNFAYPFGDVTLAAKRLVGADVVSARGIWPGINGPLVDLNLLRANRLYGDISSFAKVRDLILENERCRSWLIFYSHDVASVPSPYGCTPELLRIAVSFALQRGARILPVAEVIAELIPTPIARARDSTLPNGDAPQADQAPDSKVSLPEDIMVR